MLEAIMAGNVAAIAIVALFAGVVVGVLLAVIFVIRREQPLSRR
jgi:MFS superfamily sulfate permease-like transporter